MMAPHAAFLKRAIGGGCEGSVFASLATVELEPG